MVFKDELEKYKNIVDNELQKYLEKKECPEKI